MGQEFFIKSDRLESKVRNLLPSQGGLGQGFDLSASTQIVPIVDLTESAEGSNIREDLQRSFSLDSITAFSVNNTTTTIINNTGYYRVFGYACSNNSGAGTNVVIFTLTDGVTSKRITEITNQSTTSVTNLAIPFDFMVYLEAGHSLTCQSSASGVFAIGNTRQIASIDGTLTNP